MKYLNTIIILSLFFALCHGQNWFLNMKYNLKRKINEYFNQEFEFDKAQAENLFVQEQQDRNRKLELLKYKSTQKNSEKYKMGVCSNDILNSQWYTIIFKAFRVFITLVGAEQAEFSYIEEQKRLNRDKRCVSKFVAMETCSTAFQHNFFKERNWALNTFQKPQCKCKTVVVYRTQEKHVSRRCLLQCPTTGILQREIPEKPSDQYSRIPVVVHESKELKNVSRHWHFGDFHKEKRTDDDLKNSGQPGKMEDFNVYISSTDQGTDDNQIYFVFTEYENEFVPVPTEENENEEFLKSKETLMKNPTALGSALTSKLKNAIKISHDQVKKILKKTYQFITGTASDNVQSNLEKALQVTALLINKDR